MAEAAVKFPFSVHREETSPRFVALAHEVHRAVIEDVVAMMQATTTDEDADAVLSGALSALAQIAWETQVGPTLQAKLDHVQTWWAETGRFNFSQYLAEDLMGPAQGGAQ